MLVTKNGVYCLGFVLYNPKYLVSCSRLRTSLSHCMVVGSIVSATHPSSTCSSSGDSPVVSPLQLLACPGVLQCERRQNHRTRLPTASRVPEQQPELHVQPLNEQLIVVSSNGVAAVTPHQYVRTKLGASFARTAHSFANCSLHCFNLMA